MLRVTRDLSYFEKKKAKGNYIKREHDLHVRDNLLVVMHELDIIDLPTWEGASEASEEEKFKLMVMRDMFTRGTL